MAKTQQSLPKNNWNCAAPIVPKFKFRYDKSMTQNPPLLALALYWFVSALSVLITSWIMPGIRTSGFFAALLAAIVIAACNWLIWPALFFLTLPINILTLGLFTFVINGAILKISAAILPGFEVRSWWSAIFGAILLSLVQLVLRSVVYGASW
jgi:putative membrane protein